MSVIIAQVAGQPEIKRAVIAAERIAVKYLRVGDVLNGSGFTVTSAPYAGVDAPRGKVIIGGFYPGGTPSGHVWGANTAVRVR